MKLKEKLYRRFCAPEVRMLLDHMEENFEDFIDDYHGRKVWVRLLEAKEYSNTERTVLKMAYERLRRNHARQQLLGKIIAQKLNPAPEKKSDDSVDASRLANQYRQALANRAQYAQQGLTNRHMDPRTIFGNVL
jgi:hypothetical protein